MYRWAILLVDLARSSSHRVKQYRYYPGTTAAVRVPWF
eukprot:COSAG05_NODE_17567_length_323_cov_0.696429_1_plen_37_part_01